MTLRVPHLTFRTVDEGHPGYYVGIALDELVAYARSEGASEEELRERLDEAIEHAEEEEE